VERAELLFMMMGISRRRWRKRERLIVRCWRCRRWMMMAMTRTRMMSRRRALTQRSASPGLGRMMRTRISMKMMGRLDSGGGVILDRL
jgi:hypothetical protein